MAKKTEITVEEEGSEKLLVRPRRPIIIKSGGIRKKSKTAAQEKQEKQEKSDQTKLSDRSVEVTIPGMICRQDATNDQYHCEDSGDSNPTTEILYMVVEMTGRSADGSSNKMTYTFKGYDSYECRVTFVHRD